MTQAHVWKHVMKIKEKENDYIPVKNLLVKEEFSKAANEKYINRSH